jgi:two-component system sensor histidine kinase TctE
VTVTADRMLLREAIANLLHNAIMYTPTGGVVTVCVHERDGRPSLAVVDNGPGIAPEERERVLERFYRGPGATGSSSGLGLSIVKEICDRHGATLHLLDGREGRGLCAEMRWG